MTSSEHRIIQQTKNWVKEVVIGLNLCPFASRPFDDDTIDYIVACKQDDKPLIEQHLHQLADCFNKLDVTADIETSLLIFADGYDRFDDYLELLHYSNLLLDDLKYSGSYQLASFHPEYRFEGSSEDDASNYTNRSPYPMLHIIREDSLEQAIASYPDVDLVPENNIKKLQGMGYKKMQQILENILQA
jgi:hypothetical protein